MTENGSISRPLVVLANRLPLVRAGTGYRLADGGLTRALEPALKGRSAIWVGWDGGDADIPHSVEGSDLRLRPVPLTPWQAEAYYEGFCNRTLWPLLHDFVRLPVFVADWWGAYMEVNRWFAEMTFRADAAHQGSQQGLWWVHDYHLMLLPGLLRKSAGTNRLAFSLHTPFPAPELFARMPWRRELLRGILGADLVAFYTDSYRENFLRSCRQLLPEITTDNDGVQLETGRWVETVSLPLSVDTDGLAAQSKEPSVERCLSMLREQFRGRTVLLGVDRLDYTKGIPERMRAIELLLDRRPDLRGRIAMIQIAVPSRHKVKEYQELRAEVEEEVRRINEKYSDAIRGPLLSYAYGAIPNDRLLAYYRLADVALVTPLRDGMNLVAKEFVITQSATGGAGALVLSEFAGAAEEFSQAIRCNPFDVEGLADGIEQALGLSEDARQQQLLALAASVRAYDVFDWMEATLASIDGPPSRRAP